MSGFTCEDCNEWWALEEDYDRHICDGPSAASDEPRELIIGAVDPKLTPILAAVLAEVARQDAADIPAISVFVRKTYDATFNAGVAIRQALRLSKEGA